ncbi:MAG: hypothetical protein ACUVS7_06920 [Bryobacteraceae bacterium]
MPCAPASLARLMELAPDHLAVEERILFDLVRQWLTSGRLRELGLDSVRRRGLQLQG